MSKPVWRQIADKLSADIASGKYQVGDRLPTNSELAESNGVSRLTAHKALDELQRAGLVSRDGRRGTVVKSTAVARTGRIALIIDQIDFNYSFPRPELLAGIHSGLGKQFELVLCDAKADTEREKALISRMAEESDGIILWPTDGCRAGELISSIHSSGTPFILLDRIPKGAIAPSVVTDSVVGARMATEFLIERGHKRIALLTFDKPDVSTVKERTQAFLTVMAEHGLSTKGLVRQFPPSLEVPKRSYLNQAVGDALHALVKSSAPATAIICMQDLVGMTVLQNAEEMGLNIPAELEIVTFNDWQPMWLGRPWQAHRVAFSPEEMGRIAISNLVLQIEKPSTEISHHRVTAKFVTADGLLEPAPVPSQKLSEVG